MVTQGCRWLTHRIAGLTRRCCITNIRGDMPFGQPFGERPQRSPPIAAVLLGHQHGQGITPHSFRATIEARRASSEALTVTVIPLRILETRTLASPRESR